MPEPPQTTVNPVKDKPALKEIVEEAKDDKVDE